MNPKTTFVNFFCRQIAKEIVLSFKKVVSESFFWINVWRRVFRFAWITFLPLILTIKYACISSYRWVLSNESLTIMIIITNDHDLSLALTKYHLPLNPAGILLSIGRGFRKLCPLEWSIFSVALVLYHVIAELITSGLRRLYQGNELWWGTVQLLHFNLHSSSLHGFNINPFYPYLIIAYLIFGLIEKSETRQRDSYRGKENMGC